MILSIPDYKMIGDSIGVISVILLELFLFMGGCTWMTGLHL